MGSGPVGQARDGVDLIRGKSVNEALDTLQAALHAIAEQLYQGAQGAGGSRGSSHGTGGSSVKEGEVVDAEYAGTAQ